VAGIPSLHPGPSGGISGGRGCGGPSSPTSGVTSPVDVGSSSCDDVEPPVPVCVVEAWSADSEPDASQPPVQPDTAHGQAKTGRVPSALEAMADADHHSNLTVTNPASLPFPSSQCGPVLAERPQ